MFLGKLTVFFICISFFYDQAHAQNPKVDAAPSIDIFGDEKPKAKAKPATRPAAKPAKKAVAKPAAKQVTKKQVAKPAAKPVAKSIKPVTKPNSKAVTKVNAKGAKKKVVEAPPVSPAFPSSRIAPKPEPVVEASAPALAPTPAAPVKTVKAEPARRTVVRAAFGEFERRASVGYGTWREPLTYAVGELNRGGKASFAGFLFRYEMSKRDRPVNWGGSVGLFYGGADAKSSDSAAYRVNKVGAQALIASPFAFFEPMPDVQVKLALDIVYKIISWPSTVGANDVRTKPFGYGPNVGIEYRVWNQWSVEQKIGSYSPAGDIFWMVAATYRLP